MDETREKRSYITAVFSRYGPVTLNIKVMGEDGEWESTISLFLDGVKAQGPFNGTIDLGWCDGELRPKGK